MSKLVPTPKAPIRKTMPKIGAASNINHEKSPQLHAPRIRPLNTRDYGKGAKTPDAYPDQTNYGQGAGFGNTGMIPGGSNGRLGGI